MLGTRLRCWMETHIVRARKKQNRSKGKGKNLQDSPSTSPHINYEQPNEAKENKIAKESSEYSVDKAPMTDGQKEKTTNGVTNLSSPESAYSTGYSTDGTSPGASIPPEYYINLRTGKHYVPANTGNTGTSEAVQSCTAATRAQQQQQLHVVAYANGPGPGSGGPLTPSSARRRREEAAVKRKVKPTSHGLPESSTEEDIADRPSKPTPSHKAGTPKSQRKPIQQPINGVSHRRTESYDESHNLIFNILPPPPCTTNAERDSEGSSSTQTGGSLQCTSPFLSSASPRQRNRIRTNPWLGANANLQGDKTKNYYSPGETSSTVGSSSTISSGGYRDRVKDDVTPFSPKPVDRKLEDIKNLNMIRSATYVTSPLVNGRRPINAVTTCSPQPNRPCRHTRPGTSSSSSAPSSGSDDNHHGNTSDFSDDDITLNEMLGKYDESYVYEKETDILSDSDPTDCEEQHDYNDKILNKGHCTYVSANHTPEVCKRQCSRMRRQRSSGGDGSAPSSRGSSLNGRRVRRTSCRQRDESSDITPRRYRKKHRQPSRERKPASAECITKDPPPLPQIIPNATRIPRPSPVNEVDRKNVEQARHINLNRVLMERLIHNQRSGTRSADGTPVSLRRNGTHEYNGKYLRNPHVSKLINSNCNLIERRTSIEDRNLPKNEIPLYKKRSNSLTGYNAINPPNLPPRNPVRLENNSIDKEGDIKYRQLIQEAEHILEDFHVKPYRADYMSPTLSTKSAIIPNTEPIPIIPHRFPDESVINSQINLLEETINNNPVPKIENDEGIFKTISKTLEKIIIRNSDSKRNDKNCETLKSKKKNCNRSKTPNPVPTSPSKHPVNTIPQNAYCQEHDYVNNQLPVDNTPFTDRNDNLYRNTFAFSPRHRAQPTHNTRTQYKPNGCAGGDKEHFKNAKGVDIIRNGEYSPINLSPKMTQMNGVHRNIPRNTLTVWQERTVNLQQNDSQNGKLYKNDIPIKPPLVPFKSFDLGNKVAINSKYCPQSEPVKRKVYAGSNTFGKLQKTLMRKESEKDYDVEHMSTDALRNENTNLKEKVAQLRRERLQVEARVRETQEQIDRLRLADSSSHC
uniref:Uncharacterized protein n=1 Tax=Triatoma infestans TaxID=30076 RepID=A0A023EWY3_TRIIF